MRIAVITGASSGMGREFVIQLDKKENFDEIWVIARREDKLIDLKREVSSNIRILPYDLTITDNFKKYEALLSEINPDVALLVNCSGYGKFGRHDIVKSSDNSGMIALNCTALVTITEMTIPYMRKNGKIVQLCSLSAFQPTPFITVYGATKAFVLSYSRALNAELKSKGIRVMAVCPGWVRTEFFDRAETKDHNAITYFNKIYEAEDVIKTAIHDLYRTNKDVSIHGLRIKLQVLLVKLLPHRLVMKIWMKQQNHK